MDAGAGLPEPSVDMEDPKFCESRPWFVMFKTFQGMTRSCLAGWGLLLMVWCVAQVARLNRSYNMINFVGEPETLSRTCTV